MSVNREKLYDEVSNEPITKVSKRYGVSDSYLIRILKSLNIPRPSSIYPEIPPLPEAKLGHVITWSRDGQTEFATNASNDGKSTHSKRAVRIAAHGLVRDAHEHFKKLRDSRSPYLKSFKKITIDMIVSKDALEPSPSITSQFYLFIEVLGHHVHIAPYGQQIYSALFILTPNLPVHVCGESILIQQYSRMMQ